MAIPPREEGLRQTRLFNSTLILVVLVMVAMGCAQKSPEEKVAELRSRFTAKLNGFIVQEQPEVEAMGGELEATEITEEVAAEEVVASDMDAEMPAEVPLVVTQNVLLDVLLQHDNVEKLAGITVDISMVDSELVEKGHWRVWFDTSDLAKANMSQQTHVLEDVDYVEGDGFSVEVRTPIPENERTDYQEFAVQTP